MTTSPTSSRSVTASSSPRCPEGEFRSPSAPIPPTATHFDSCSEEGIPAFEELFLYACPKFISANPPPYDDPEVLSTYIDDPPVEPAQRHLSLFLSDVRAQAPVPTLRSFLKLYTSLDAKKLAGFLDADEEEMVQQLMVMKQASRSVSRVGDEKGGLLDGQMISTSDLDFVIREVRRVLFCLQRMCLRRRGRC